MFKTFFAVLFFAFLSIAEANFALTNDEQILLLQREKIGRTDVIKSDNEKELKLLHSRSREIDVKGKYVDVLINQMKKTLSANHGMGLTAVQIGMPVRVVIMQRTVMGRDDFYSFLNPEVIHASATKDTFLESCLSIKREKKYNIKRSLHLKIRYQNFDGKIIMEDLTGLEAAIFQQEMEHLDGILLSDHHEH